ncbi:MAG: hypothetical protein ABIE70_02365 [bacterium]
MSDPQRGMSGLLSIFQRYEARRIVIGVGTQYHEDELSLEKSDFQYLEERLGSAFRVQSNRKEAEYVSDQQKVIYYLEVVHKMREFKRALETPGIIAIYSGHSRYGRGACFGDYTGAVAGHGEHWGNGNTLDDGIFRLGYPLVPVTIEDIGHHQYRFEPLKVEDPPPARAYNHPFLRHPHARRGWRRVPLPPVLQSLVAAGYSSPSNTYWGLRRRGETYLILNAGWNCSNTSILDLGGTTMNCKTFCHFGCSSQTHFWDIVRRTQYKGYVRDNPPTNKFAYFTTASADARTYYWLYYLLAFPRDNAFQSWWESHQYAKNRANIKLRADRAGFQIY